MVSELLTRFYFTARQEGRTAGASLAYARGAVARKADCFAFYTVAHCYPRPGTRRADSRESLYVGEAEALPRLRYVESRLRSHTWRVDETGAEFRAAVLSLPRGRFLPGYVVDSGGFIASPRDVSGLEPGEARRLYRAAGGGWRGTQAAEAARESAREEAERDACRLAERAAEEESEYQEAWAAGREAGEALEAAREALAEALANGRLMRADMRRNVAMARASARGERAGFVPLGTAAKFLGRAREAKAARAKAAEAAREAWAEARAAWAEALPGDRDSILPAFVDGAALESGYLLPVRHRAALAREQSR